LRRIPDERKTPSESYPPSGKKSRKIDVEGSGEEEVDSGLRTVSMTD
jgi:hypothetical protein